jgi:hypothetical protein
MCGQYYCWQPTRTERGRILPVCFLHPYHTAVFAHPEHQRVGGHYRIRARIHGLGAKRLQRLVEPGGLTDKPVVYVFGQEVVMDYGIFIVATRARWSEPGTATVYRDVGVLRRVSM